MSSILGSSWGIVTNIRKLINYKQDLLYELRDPQKAIAYLNACLTDEDPRVFLVALKDVLSSINANMSKVAKRSTISRKSLYHMLSDKGNPKLNNIISVLDALGLQLAVQPKK